MRAMVFAAGLGTRLKPVTDSMPKALVPVCGEPLLGHVLRKLAASGYDEIVVNVHHFAGQIREYLDSHDFGVRISVSDETDLLRETGGAIRHARPLLEDAGSFLVHNVDIISDLDLRWFREQCRPEALATLLVSERKTQRYFLFDDSMRLVGWTNIATGEVRSPYPGLDPGRCRQFAFAGIHCISSGVFDVFDSYCCPERFPIVDFYLRACAEHPIYGAVPESLTLIDVGKLDSLAEAERVCRACL
ncbi:MAG: nucleotidyltransferase family protein [Bacteroidales bacterium]|nr:nucleotidyltransferase family protein [Bacteroidales bacterium]